MQNTYFKDLLALYIYLDHARMHKTQITFSTTTVEIRDDIRYNSSFVTDYNKEQIIEHVRNLIL